MINEDKIHSLLKEAPRSSKEVEDILSKARKNATILSSEHSQSLRLEEIAKLLNVDSDNSILMQKIFDTALEIKQKIYGNRIVLFAPLYVSNYCASGCSYCGFRADNGAIERKILNEEELIKEVEELQKQGHKRLLMLMGDHPKYSLDDFIKDLKIASTVKTKNNGAIRRINIEIPALGVNDLKRLKEIDCIGTYALFQETYHKKTYKKMHPYGPKSDYDYRLYSMDRALEAGLDDVGLGALFGLYDYRFEVLALLMHSMYLDKTFSVGPHTISVPRIQEAINTPCSIKPPYPVNDLDFKKLVAIIRIAVPYTGLILSTRESAQMRKELLDIGVSQISAGSKTEVGAYNKKEKMKFSQFSLNDTRPTSEVVFELIKQGYIPSWCTACYRSNRTGEAFMKIAKKGDIHNLCHPNALLTFAEFLIDFADKKTKKAGWQLIEKEAVNISSKIKKKFFTQSLEKVRNGKRDLYI